MLKNYVLVALRTLRKQPVYTGLNVLGLAVGMTCCVLIGLYVQNELAYDRFHERGERIYRVEAGPDGQGAPTNANGGFSYGPALEEAFPEIERAVRFVKAGWGEQRVFARGERRYYEGDVLFADPGIFEVFSFPLAAGDAQTALGEPQTVVLTQASAAKYFPGEDALGQTIQVDPFNDGRFVEYTVTGVLDALPGPTHLPFEVLLSYASLPPLDQPVWGYEPAFTYLLLAPGADADALEARFVEFQDREVSATPPYRLHLRPVRDIHLHGGLNAELQPNGDITYVYLFSAIALFILLLGCINFMNLATARSAQRAKEVGLRKAVGAARGQLIGQFLGEAMLLSVLGAALALVLTSALLPTFNSIAGTTLVLSGSEVGVLAGALVGLALLVGMAAGSYPALFLSAIRPATILKGARGRGGRRAARLREGLVVFQFAVTIALLACTTIVAQQMRYARQVNLGFDRDQVVVLPLNDALRDGAAAFRAEALGHPAIEAVSYSEQVPARAGNGSSYRVEGYTEHDRYSAFRMFTDLHFIDTYGLEVVAGRSYSEGFPSDVEQAFVVSERVVQEVGWASPEEALGKQIEMRWSNVVRTGSVVGVVRDFNAFSLRDSTQAMVLNPMPLSTLNFVSVRLRPSESTAALAHLRDTWATFSPAYPFDYYFLDDDFHRLHQADERLGRVFQAFALLAVIVACLGLFGLAAFVAEQRTREIGVRKVLGASVAGLVGLLSQRFLLLVALAFVVATPAAYLAMRAWLSGFAYRPTLSAWPFVIAGATALTITLVTVGTLALRAAIADPVKALRHE